MTLYYTDGKNKSTPLSVISLGYSGSVQGSDYEIWDTSTPIGVDGITQLLNITYQATDVTENFQEILNLPVNTTGSTPPTGTAPKPYASPSGFAKDITKFLGPDAASEAGIALTRMFLNIEVTDAANGTIVAAQSYANPE